MKKLRLTFRCEVEIEAPSYADAMQKFYGISLFSDEATENGAEFVEMVSVEDGDTYEDVTDRTDSYRTYDDTQIYLDVNEREGVLPLVDEIFLIKAKSDNHYKEYHDKANGLYAFSIPHISQYEDEDFAEELVDELNELAEKTGAGACWYVGDIDEEYVFVE